MKRTLLASLALAPLVLATTAAAQSQNFQPVRVDLTTFGAYGPADAAAYGFGAALEPKYNLTDRISLGLRLEGSAFVMQAVKVGDDGSASVSQSARVVTAYLAKADYYLTTSSARPFVGLALGRYQIDSGSQSVDAGSSGGASVVQQVKSFAGWGVAPQVGVNFGGFRMAATYHVITGDDQVIVTQAVGELPKTTTLSKNYFAFEIGGTFGGKRRASQDVGAAGQAPAPQM